MNTPAIRSQLPIAIEMINKKLEQIRKVTEGTTKTNGMFTYTPNNAAKTINIGTSTDLGELIEIYSFLKLKADNYAASAEELGLNSYPVFKWCNYTFAQWKNDLQIRVAVVSSHNQTKELRDQKTKLEKFLTDDQQLSTLLKEMGMDNIQETSSGEIK